MTIRNTTKKPITFSSTIPGLDTLVLQPGEERSITEVELMNLKLSKEFNTLVQKGTVKIVR